MSSLLPTATRSLSYHCITKPIFSFLRCLFVHTFCAACQWHSGTDFGEKNEIRRRWSIGKRVTQLWYILQFDLTSFGTTRTVQQVPRETRCIISTIIRSEVTDTDILYIDAPSPSRCLLLCYAMMSEQSTNKHMLAQERGTIACAWARMVAAHRRQRANESRPQRPPLCAPRDWSSLLMHRNYSTPV